MLDKVVSGLSAFIIAVISTLGYGGVVLMMAIESACIPVPSEVIMPFSGFLVASGRFNLNMVAVMGALGCLLGSYLAYYVGANGGRRFIERYGRYLLIAPHELEIADRFFARWGSLAVFLCRLLPVVRTFIAFPAGVSRMKLLPFTIYTLLGSYLWCLARIRRDEIGAELERSRAVLSSLRRAHRDSVGLGSGGTPIQPGERDALRPDLRALEVVTTQASEYGQRRKTRSIGTRRNLHQHRSDSGPDGA